MECFDLKGRCEVGLKESAHSVIGGANEAFRFAVLWRGVGTREAVSNAGGREEIAKGGVDKLATIVALHALDDDIILRVNEREKAT